ncbi:MAG TPA: SDR family NAD(P)-dependent oxidoreductase [Candidatus Saccharimonadales bacterium]|nr:SDR family NAD(P)-dependent oxidoreductase [Candidatus Saccharimonadales bacterium]
MSSINNRDESLLRGHVALITGGSRGIGKAIAAKLAQFGASISICGRDRQVLQAAAEELRPLPSNVLAQPADVTKTADITSLVHATETQLGPITLLVNNAGIGNPGFGSIQEKSEDDWDRVLDTNLKSAFLVSRAVAPLMIQRRRGDIINISSLAGKNVFAGGALYCASKWGLQGLSGCMAEDLRQYGIRVSVICPGSVATEFSGRGPKDLTKVLTPEDVAHAVAMLALQGPQSFISEVHLRPVSKP